MRLCVVSGIKGDFATGILMCYCLYGTGIFPNSFVGRVNGPDSNDLQQSCCSINQAVLTSQVGVSIAIFIVAIDVLFAQRPYDRATSHMFCVHASIVSNLLPTVLMVVRQGPSRGSRSACMHLILFSHCFYCMRTVTLRRTTHMSASLSSIL